MDAAATCIAQSHSLHLTCGGRGRPAWAFTPCHAMQCKQCLPVRRLMPGPAQIKSLYGEMDDQLEGVGGGGGGGSKGAKL